MAHSTFGEWVQKRRKAQDWTQGDLAKKLASSAILVRKIEAGERKPSQQLAELLADTFAVPANEREEFLKFARGRTNTTPHNLSAAPNTLIGRNDDIAEAQKILLQAATRLVTLVGAPGVGKSRLAMQLAFASLAHFDEGVYFVELAEITNSERLLRTVCRTLGLTLTADHNPRQELLQLLRNRKLLLILDNVEQLLDRQQGDPTVALLFADLLASCPQLKLLITSRLPLRIRAERQFPVLPLALPNPKRLPPTEQLLGVAAIALFVERAQAVHPRFRLTPENAPFVVDLCNRLDGLPLAIELVAARAVQLWQERRTLAGHAAGAFDPAQHFSRLAVAVDGPLDLPQRQQTLRNAIDWSYSLLNAPEQQLLRRIAAFAGAADLRFLSPELSGLDPTSQEQAIQALEMHHLLQRREDRDSTTRLHLLETVSEFALERLVEAGELTASYRLLTQQLAAMAVEANIQLAGEQQALWLRRLDAEQANLSRMMHWAFDFNDSQVVKWAATIVKGLRYYWITVGDVSEGRHWLRVALSKLDPNERDLTASLLNGLGAMAQMQDDLHEAGESYQRALLLFAESGNQRGKAAALSNLGQIAEALGDYTQAHRYQQQALAIEETLGNQYGIAESLVALGSLELSQKNDSTAQRHYLAAQTIYQQLHHEAGIASCEANLAQIASQQGQHHSAQTLIASALRRIEQENIQSLRGQILRKQGQIRLADADFSGAQSALLDAARCEQSSQSTVALALCLDDLARVAMAQQQWQQAVQWLSTAESLCSHSERRRAVADQRDFESSLEQCRAQLSPLLFTKAWQRGSTTEIDRLLV